jgi:hypothetical protein
VIHWRSSAPLSLGASLGVACLAFALWSLFAFVHERVKPADFYVFWAAARHWRAPYDPSVVSNLEAALHITGAWPFAYPPTFLFFVWPFALAPVELAYPLWTGVTSALFFFAAARFVRPGWAMAILFIAPPVVLAVSPGQTSLLVGASMIAGFGALKDRPALAGVLFAVAACVKPQAMILAPLVLWGHWRVAVWTLVASAALIVASCVFGPERWLEWSRALAAFQQVIPATDRVNPSAVFDGVGARALLALLGAWIAARSRDVVGLVGGGLCLTPYAHQYDLAPLVPVAATWLFEFKKHGLGYAVAGAALLAGFIATPLAGLAFVLGLGALKTPWRALWPAAARATA